MSFEIWIFRFGQPDCDDDRSILAKQINMKFYEESPAVSIIELILLRNTMLSNNYYNIKVITGIGNHIWNGRISKIKVKYKLDKSIRNPDRQSISRTYQFKVNKIKYIKCFEMFTVCSRNSTEITFLRAKRGWHHKRK